MADYTDEIDRAYDDIKEDGCAIKLKRSNVGGTYVPATDSYTGGSVASCETYGVVSNYADALIDGKNIQAGDRLVLVPAKDLTITPQTQDVLIFTGDSTEHPIVNVKTVAPSNTAILHKVQIRG